MSWTAEGEARGSGVQATIGADYRLRLPSYPGGARFYDLTATSAGLKVRVPDARLMRCGPEVFTVYNRTGGNQVSIVAQDGSTGIHTLPTGRVVDLHLVDNGTANGTWRVTETSGVVTV